MSRCVPMGDPSHVAAKVCKTHLPKKLQIAFYVTGVMEAGTRQCLLAFMISWDENFTLSRERKGHKGGS